MNKVTKIVQSGVLESKSIGTDSSSGLYSEVSPKMVNVSVTVSYKDGSVRAINDKLRGVVPTKNKTAS